MPFHLPLAADWGDLIFLIVVLVGGLVQWIGGLKKKPAPGDAEPREFSPYGESEPGVPGRPHQDPDDYDPEPSWDELMDALGKKPSEGPPPVPATVPAPPPAYVPPLPVPTPRAEPASLSSPFRTLQDPSPSSNTNGPDLSDHVKTLLAAMDQSRPTGQEGPGHKPSGIHLLEPRKAGDIPTVTGRTNTRFGRLLHEPGQVRRAIVLQEILQPPLALR